MLKLQEGQFVKLTGTKVKGENDIYIVKNDYNIKGKYAVCRNEYCLVKVKLNGTPKSSGYRYYFYNEKSAKNDSKIKIEIVTDLKKAKKEVNNYLKLRESEEVIVDFKKAECQEVKDGSIIRFSEGIKFGTFGDKYISSRTIWKVNFRENGTIYIKQLGKKGQILAYGDEYGCSLGLTKQMISACEVLTKIEIKKGDILKESKNIKINDVKQEKEQPKQDINNIELNKCDFGYCKECSKLVKEKGYTGCIFAIKENKLNSDEIENTNIEIIEEVKPVEKITETKKNIYCKIVFNEDKNGIELYFTDKPSEKIRKNIKSNGFMWNGLKLCWFIKDTETARKYLQELGLLNEDNKQQNIEIKTEELKEIEEPKIIIDETLAKRAKENMSFNDYKEGSATQEYNNTVEEIAKKIDLAKEKVSDESKIKLDKLLNWFKKAYADWINKHNANGASHVSWMISGRGNYNMNKHNKWEKRESKLWEEYNSIINIDSKISKILNGDKIIKSSDKNALDKLRAKLEQEEKQHQEIKEYNKKARKEGKEPYATYVLQNSNQRMKNIKDRIKHLEKLSQQETKETEINGIKIVDNVEANRLQIIFNGKPNEETRSKLKSNGFRWSPNNGAWQRFRSLEAERKAKMIIESIAI